VDDVPARLIVKRGPNPNQEYILPAVEVTIGRSSTNIIAIPDPEVSRRHACVRLESNSYTVEDWTSTNGTFVNGQRISGPVTLYDGDEIRLGDTVTLQFTADDPQFQRSDWSHQVVASNEETIVESVPPAWETDGEADSALAPLDEQWTTEAPLVPEQDMQQGRFRRWTLGCGCGFLIVIFLCMATLFFLDAYQQGRLLYCGPIRPFFEILLGPFGFAPICP
jgi:pSer/pThr/pTyr-binding forkhead associated (FHA) protein